MGRAGRSCLVPANRPEVPSARVDAVRPSNHRPEDSLDEEWHQEARVQAAVVTALAGEGWRILSVADTASRARGVDILAVRNGETIGVEVKGYPSRQYADPARSHERKPTAPSNQAGHWYAQAVLAAMRLRSRERDWRSVIALPDFSRYRDLHRETVGSLAAAGIDVWWVHRDGDVVMDGAS